MPHKYQWEKDHDEGETIFTAHDKRMEKAKSLNKTQLSMRKMLHEAGKHIRGKNESYMHHLKRVTKHSGAKSHALHKKIPLRRSEDLDFSGATTNDR